MYVGYGVNVGCAVIWGWDVRKAATASSTLILGAGVLGVQADKKMMVSNRGVSFLSIARLYNKKGSAPHSLFVKVGFLESDVVEENHRKDAANENNGVEYTHGPEEYADDLFIAFFGGFMPCDDADE